MEKQKLVSPESVSAMSTATEPELKIIGASLGRTGTISLKAALEQLGFGPCYHQIGSVGKYPDVMEQWIAAAEGQSMNWHEVFRGYQSTVAWPACFFYEEIMQAFPKAKVLLTVRDPERWYESVKNTMYKIVTGPDNPLEACIYKLFLKFDRNDQMLNRLNNAVIWQGAFAGRFEDKEYAISVYNRHIEEVKHKIPSDKLLVFNIKEGWEPLCAFLGVKVPDLPFPHLNDQENFPNNIYLRFIHQWMIIASLVLAGSVTLGAVLLLFRALRR